MLCQVNYRVPNMKFLREKFPDVELRNGDVSYSQFAQLYRSLMFDAQKSNGNSFPPEISQRDLTRPESRWRTSRAFLLEYQKELWATRQ
uniref:Uncharacterized protein n=1 Tax=Anguilla anguilla TaxID=7936 RepID=A0A0E9Q7H6_ANGAN